MPCPPPTAAEKASDTRASDILFAAPHAGRSRSRRDSEARAVQGGRGLRSRRRCSRRAAFVGDGVSRARCGEVDRRAAGVPPHRRRAGAQIRHLLLVEGLTLAGVRRKLEEQTAPVGGCAVVEALIGENARERLTAVKRGLQSILELLTGANSVDEFRFAAPTTVSAASRMRSMPSRGRPLAARRPGHARIGALAPGAPQAFGVKSEVGT